MSGKLTVKYLGDRDAVELQIGLQWVEVNIGDEVDVDPAMAAGLLIQTDRWEPASPAAAKLAKQLLAETPADDAPADAGEPPAPEDTDPAAPAADADPEEPS